MNPWPFVAAAYAAAILLTAALLAWAFVSMRRAEASADAMKRTDRAPSADAEGQER